MERNSRSSRDTREGEEGLDRLVVMRKQQQQQQGRAEIDTSAPFRSVKEAVVMFGETVLAADVYSPNTIKHRIQHGTTKNVHVVPPMNNGTVTAGVRQMEQSLHLPREEGLLMANCLMSLKEELEETKRELKQFKSAIESEKKQQQRQQQQQCLESEQVEYLKFVENVMEAGTQTPDMMNLDEVSMSFENKPPFVKFANPPTLARVITDTTEGSYDVLQRHPASPKRKKSKRKKLRLIPLLGGIFTHKKGVHNVPLPKNRAP